MYLLNAMTTKNKEDSSNYKVSPSVSAFPYLTKGFFEIFPLKKMLEMIQSNCHKRSATRFLNVEDKRQFTE